MKSAPTDVNGTGTGKAATADRSTVRVFATKDYDGVLGTWSCYSNGDTARDSASVP